MSKSSATRPNRESVSKRIGPAATAQIHSRDGGRCVYCTQTAAESGARLQLDHLTARDLGGRDEYRNLVLACARCNRAKSNLTLVAWTVYAATKLQLTLDARAIRAHARRLPRAA